MKDYCNKGSTLLFHLPSAVQILYCLTCPLDFLSTTVYLSLTENKSLEQVILKMAWMCFNQQIQCNQQTLILEAEGLF